MHEVSLLKSVRETERFSTSFALTYAMFLGQARGMNEEAPFFAE
jgi:hypothetical protein